MERCQQCGSEAERAAPFCSQCGSPLRKTSAASPAADAPTAASPDAPAHTPPRKPPASHPSRDQASHGEERFAPGILIAERSMLERFRNEVRIARRISHPNVCRVFDIGDANNQVFLSMEYVDGEDLSSLLRRIGRLPRDQALEIARKICAGLAAAHDKGVLHRDLKPSNIMLTARGEVRVMDFGLAGLAHEIEDVRSGTPAYMAPEQLAGREVTARSDMYALGLLLYELFTGKPAFEGNTRDQIMRARRESSPQRPSTLVPDLDPAVEMVIMRCLEEDPENRPSSAVIVSAALPGGEYLIAIYLPDDYDPSLETEAMHRDIDVLNDEMVAAGVRVFVAGLCSPSNARSLRVQPDGQVLVTNGPYTHTPEHMVGFFVVKAADLDQALAWGRKTALAARASVEVRPFDYPKR